MRKVLCHCKNSLRIWKFLARLTWSQKTDPTDFSSLHLLTISANSSLIFVWTSWIGGSLPNITFMSWGSRIGPPGWSSFSISSLKTWASHKIAVKLIEKAPKCPFVKRLKVQLRNVSSEKKLSPSAKWSECQHNFFQSVKVRWQSDVWHCSFLWS